MSNPVHYAVCDFHGVIFADDSGDLEIKASNMVPIHPDLYGKPKPISTALCPYPEEKNESGVCGKGLKFI